MHILDVVPLIPLPRSQPGTVSYFYSTPLSRGTIVEVLFNNRKIKAVVVASASLASRKLQFKKQADFTLKKIERATKKSVNEEQIKKAYELSEYYFTPLGICMRAVVLHPELVNYSAGGGSSFGGKKYLVTGPVVDLDDVPLENPKNKIKIVDMRKEIRDANFSIFSRHLKEALQTYDRLVIFIPRKGYANFLLCKDCGSGIKCPNCSTSLVYHKDELICHHCNHREAIPKTCPSCKSYNLKPYGVGIEKVEAELIKFFSYQNLTKPKIAQLTSDTKKLPENLPAQAGWNILLATQSLFQYRNTLKVPYIAIMNADALIHVPDFRAEELLLRQTLLLASMTERLLVQTYNPLDPALVAAATGMVDEFWKAELEQRKAFGYPPFTKLVKITLKNKYRNNAQQYATTFAQQFGGTAYPALIDRERGMYVYNILLKFPPDATSYTLHATLDRVPPDWQIDVDPINIV